MVAAGVPPRGLIPGLDSGTLAFFPSFRKSGDREDSVLETRLLRGKRFLG
jgi:hypothetical protein